LPGELLRVAFYARVSSDEQAERATARNQTDFLTKKYAANFEPDSLEPMQYVGTFVDDGWSGALPLADRPDGARLLELVRARGVDVVISYRLDRLGRRLGVLLDVHTEFQRHDVAILSATEPFDTRTPIGQFLFQLLGSLAELERETIRERFTLGRDRVARDGKFINGPVPIGYTLDAETQQLVPSERKIPQLGLSEADLVRTLFQRAADGESAAALTVWLRALGVPSTKRYIRRDGTESEEVYPAWNAARMQDLLHSSTYYGDRALRYSGNVIHQDVPPLVDRETWDRANATLTGRVTKFNSGQNDGYVYLLSGKLFCTECGSRMHGNYQRRQRGDKPRLYYACGSARLPRGRRLATSCQSARNHDGWALEALVLEAIDDYVANPEHALQILREQVRARRGSSAEQDDRVRALRQRLAGYEHAKQTLLVMVRRNELTREEYLAQIAASAEESAAVRHELELAEAEDNLSALIETRLLDSVSVLHELRERWPAARQADNRALLRTMVQGTLREMRLAPDGQVHIAFSFTPPASRQNNREHYQFLYRETQSQTSRENDQLAAIGFVRGLVDLELARRVGKSA
jgi:site-specific DNA recombinase